MTSWENIQVLSLFFREPRLTQTASETRPLLAAFSRAMDFASASGAGSLLTNRAVRST